MLWHCVFAVDDLPAAVACFDLQDLVLPLAGTVGDAVGVQPRFELFELGDVETATIGHIHSLIRSLSIMACRACFTTSAFFSSDSFHQ